MRLRSACVGLVLGVGVACSPAGESAQGTGGSATTGGTASSSGGSATGGTIATTGGTSTGGTATSTGGTATTTGGSATGGTIATTGGTSTGGTSTGGTSTGGSATSSGGTATSSGGTSTGGSAGGGFTGGTLLLKDNFDATPGHVGFIVGAASRDNSGTELRFGSSVPPGFSGSMLDLNLQNPMDGGGEVTRFSNGYTTGGNPQNMVARRSTRTTGTASRRCSAALRASSTCGSTAPSSRRCT